MPFVTVKAIKNQAVIADKCVVAKSYFTRLRGLIGRAELASGEGMYFPRCNDIHMWFMRIPIDVIFIQAESENAYRVSSAHSRVRPWKLWPLRDSRARDTLELPSGTIERYGIRPGDELCIS